METKDYAKKLEGFNSTKKYRRELQFLIGLFPDKGSEFVLDYGCGIGTAVKYINTKTMNFARGYDVEKYDPNFDYITHVSDKYDVIYFMHSLAHISYIDIELKKLKSNLRPNGVIIVVTPNREWLDINKNPNYVPDPTVFKHYSQSELNYLFTSSGYNVVLSGGFGDIRASINERIFLVAELNS